MIITIIAFIVSATFISAFIILIKTVNVFKSPSEIKYKIEYIDIEKSKIWMMENQQKDYDKKTHDKKDKSRCNHCNDEKPLGKSFFIHKSLRVLIQRRMD